MMRLFSASLTLLALVNAQLVTAQSWSSGSGRTVDWDSTPENPVGDGVDRVAEVSTATQGGDPPALSSEPAAIDENGVYTRTAWFGTPTLPGDRFDNGEAKFRITCNMAFFGSADPIIANGQPSPHHHTFIGNMGVFENGGIAAVRTADYTALRNNPKSSCSGGPLNATLYWEPTLYYEVATGVFVPVRPNNVSFYYTLGYGSTDKMYRLLRGLAFIGGVDPADRLNTARLAEIPEGQGWLKTRRYNGWIGWACFNASSIVPLAVGNTADENPQAANYARQLVNSDGSDPWGGACESASYILIANNLAPSCWDGHNRTSPNGRDHFRYPIWQGSDQTPEAYYCPDGWWQVPHFEVKTEFPNGTISGDAGHAWRSKLHLSSDRMDANPANWHPRGSTFHFDWMNGWDSVVQRQWQDKCTGTDQNGDAGEPLTCNDSTISDTEKLKTLQASPDPTLSNDPILTFHSYYNDASKDAFGPVEDGTVVDLTVTHDH
jgi:hypothetical protein